MPRQSVREPQRSIGRGWAIPDKQATRRTVADADDARAAFESAVQRSHLFRHLGKGSGKEQVRLYYAATLPVIRGNNCNYGKQASEHTGRSKHKQRNRRRQHVGFCQYYCHDHR